MYSIACYASFLSFASDASDRRNMHDGIIQDLIESKGRHVKYPKCLLTINRQLLVKQ